MLACDLSKCNHRIAVSQSWLVLKVPCLIANYWLRKICLHFISYCTSDCIF